MFQLDRYIGCGPGSISGNGRGMSEELERGLVMAEGVGESTSDKTENCNN